MLQSELFTKTYKEKPKGEESVNAILLQRAGFIYKEMAGVYSFLPLGLRALKNIESIVREEMNKIGGQEVLMTVLQPRALWQKTNRWAEGIGKEVMYKCKAGTEVGLGPTHEEMLTDIVSKYVQSEDDLPLAIYQIQTKFRKEARAKSGLLRGREFPMKDLYSFHSTEQDFKRYYNKVKKAYLRIFKRCGLQAIVTEASGGVFTKDFSHEFQVLAEGGEDTIIYCPALDFSQNKEITKYRAGQKCPVCGAKLKQGRSIEVGNIFPLGCKYSKALGALFTDKKGQRKPIIMGCYGIGISRLMGAVAEVHHDEKGLIWPQETAPFALHLLALYNTKNASDKIYNRLINAGFEVLYDDDRENKSAGEKFAEADLIGIPLRIVVSQKTLSKASVEIKKRTADKGNLVKANKLIAAIRNFRKICH